MEELYSDHDTNSQTSSKRLIADHKEETFAKLLYEDSVASVG